MIEMHVPRSRLFYENFLPGAVVVLNGGGYGLVVGSDSDSERAQQINPELLREVLIEHLTRWQNSGGEVDEPLRVAIEARRLAIRTPGAVYISPFPLLLQCSNPNCRLIDAPGRAQRSARVGALASRIRGGTRGIACRECGASLEQLPFVQVHRCGRIGDIEPPIAIRGRRLRFHDGGTFFRSHWMDFSTGENVGRALQGECPTCSQRHAGKVGIPMAGAKLRGGRAEPFFSQLLQFVALRSETTDLLRAFRASVPDPAELGRAVICGLLGLQDAAQLRANLRATVNSGVLGHADAAALEQEYQKLKGSIDRLRSLPDMEIAVAALEEKLRALHEKIHRIGGLFAAAELYIADRGLLSSIGASQRATEAALIRGEFRELCLDDDIAVAAPARRVLLEETRSTLLRDYGVREVRHIDDLAVVVAAAGFTRQAQEPNGAPGEVPLRLNAFVDEVTDSLGGKVPIYALPARTECILLRLDPCRVLRWAVDNLNWDAPQTDVLIDSAKAHAHIVAAAPALASSPGEIRQFALSGADRYATHILGLLHSLTHGALRAARNGSGYDLHSLVEYLFPADLSALIFVSSRKDFTMGGLQALYQYGLQPWLGEAAISSVTCVFDPVCSEQGGSCHGCLQLPLGCQTFNHGISRAYLHGGTVFGADGQALTVCRGFWT